MKPDENENKPKDKPNGFDTGSTDAVINKLGDLIKTLNIGQENAAVMTQKIEQLLAEQPQVADREPQPQQVEPQQAEPQQAEPSLATPQSLGYCF